MTIPSKFSGSLRAVSLGLFLLLGASCITFSGCGDGRPKRVPVSGQVLIDGKPLTWGFVRLLPENGRPATGEIGPDGRFTLTTFEDGDGAVLGTHDVIVLANEQLSETTRRWHAPKKYTNAATSGLTQTIDGPTDSLVINLTWDGGHPFTERDQ